MTWLRIHDGFTSNSKIAQLSDRDFRVWMRLLCYCGNTRDPSVDSVAKREVSGLTSARVSRFKTLRLLDQIGDELEVHDWPKYLPKDEQNAARQAKWRSRHRNAQRNAERNALSNADVDAPGDAEASRTRAGTRGFPSRPVEVPNSVTATETARARHPDPPVNGSGNGSGHDLTSIEADVAAALDGLTEPEDTWAT